MSVEAPCTGCILTVVLYNDVFGELQKANEIVNGCKRALYLKIIKVERDVIRNSLCVLCLIKVF